MKQGAREKLIAATIVVVFVAGLCGFAVVKSYNEARVYNRLTGASVTTWDALWVDLRVQEGVKR